MNNINLRVAAKAVIVKDGKLLILREANTYEEGTNQGKYHFPGGRIEAEESFIDALSREVLEETGLKVKPGKPVFVGEWWPEIKGVKNHIVAIFVLCELVSGELILSDEHDHAEWITESSWKKLDVMPPDDEVINSAFEVLNS